jgi:hypothetical protein
MKEVETTQRKRINTDQNTTQKTKETNPTKKHGVNSGAPEG